ncbi:MAG: transposase [Bdellovibrionaceae bacterium]|nr:transposase [Pseudobdellovibrionaceae bacterium]MBK9322312.1 transposase [Pseudobdellovibrionaceae bacterium]
MKKRFTDDQIIGAVKKLEAGMPAKELSRELGVTQQTLYHWKKKFSGMDVADARRLKELESENTKLKRLVADLSLDIVMLKDVNSKKW